MSAARMTTVWGFHITARVDCDLGHCATAAPAHSTPHTNNTHSLVHYTCSYKKTYAQNATDTKLIN